MEESELCVMCNTIEDAKDMFFPSFRFEEEGIKLITEVKLVLTLINYYVKFKVQFNSNWLVITQQ